MNLYQNNTAIVLNYLSEGRGKQTSYWLVHSCFAQLESYLAVNELSYSKEVGQQWLAGQSKSVKTLQIYAKALRQLDDVYRVGHICFSNRSGLKLTDAFDELISKYLSAVSGTYTYSHLANILNRCRFFFGFMQMDRQISMPCDIKYRDIMAFCEEALADLCKADFSMYKSTARNLLSWMAEQQLCPTGFSMLLFMGRAKKTVMLDCLPQETSEKIRTIGTECYQDFPPEEFYTASLEFCRDLEQLGYASTMMSSARATLDLLYLFLDINQLGYSPEVAGGWFEETGKSCSGCNVKMSRRILALFEMFTQEGTVRPEKTFVYKPLLCDQLPEWCREVILPFLEQKRKEHKAESTVCMYRSATTRFCRFLEKEGITSFSQVDTGILKIFNLTDRHETADGKNAYNVRIRKFLSYLAENGYVENYFLGEALPCAAAPRTRVVKVLTSQETRVLEEYSEDDAALGLRNRAIALIGLKMGLRGSDITSLTVNQIDWQAQCIRFRQKKTDVEKVLPMPTEVGNALYLYLTEGRPESRSGYIFITHKAPYRKIGRSVCKRIMQNAFPEKRDKGAGFHITRKTFATQRFRSQCGCSEVADLLGHTTTDTVQKYISLDEERMRLCPVFLADAGILMEGGFRNE